jgi:hypothetical protein
MHASLQEEEDDDDDEGDEDDDGRRAGSQGKAKAGKKAAQPKKAPGKARPRRSLQGEALDNDHCWDKPSPPSTFLLLLVCTEQASAMFIADGLLVRSTTAATPLGLLTVAVCRAGTCAEGQEARPRR